MVRVTVRHPGWAAYNQHRLVSLCNLIAMFALGAVRPGIVWLLGIVGPLGVVTSFLLPAVRCAAWRDGDILTIRNLFTSTRLRTDEVVNLEPWESFITDMCLALRTSAGKRIVVWAVPLQHLNSVELQSLGLDAKPGAEYVLEIADDVSTAGEPAWRRLLR